MYSCTRFRRFKGVLSNVCSLRAKEWKITIGSYITMCPGMMIWQATCDRCVQIVNYRNNHPANYQLSLLGMETGSLFSQLIRYFKYFNVKHPPPSLLPDMEIIVVLRILITRFFFILVSTLLNAKKSSAKLFKLIKIILLTSLCSLLMWKAYFNVYK